MQFKKGDRVFMDYQINRVIHRKIGIIIEDQIPTATYVLVCFAGKEPDFYPTRLLNLANKEAVKG